MESFEGIVKRLIDRGETIATMESCTGGGVSNAITNVEGSSSVLKTSVVTYSNEYKIKMGVDPKVIDEFSVYSMETAHEMARNISQFANSTYGIGITGKLNRKDENNDYGLDNEVFISIYNDGVYYDEKIIVDKETRALNKDVVIDLIIYKLGCVLNEKDK